MRSIATIGAALLLTASAVLATGTVTMHAPEVYEGPCDASAAVPITDGLFLMAGDDENGLRVFRTDRPGAAVVESDALYRFLGIAPGDKHPEADIEGGTWLGDRVYWITSHGRNEDGEWRPNRYRLFALTLRFDAGALEIEPVGKPYKDLVDDLLGAPALQDLHLRDAVRPGEKKVPDLSPKKDGLNIEGLSATPSGQLLVGFRNPRPAGKALLVTIENPDGVVSRGERAAIGSHYLVDLGGLGIRSIEYSRARSAYLIIAGAAGEGGESKLYQWSGQANDAPVLLTSVPMLNPEALIVFPNRSDIELLSDDGSKKVRDRDNCPPSAIDGECKCKELKPAAQRFRSVWYTFD